MKMEGNPINKGNLSRFFLVVTMICLTAIGYSQTAKDYLQQGKELLKTFQCDEAYSRFLIAAEMGDDEAQYLLGSAFYRGSCGREKDFYFAEKWLQKSADQGNADAQKLLVELREVIKEYSELYDREVRYASFQMPEFPGGKEALMEFIQKNKRYPEKAKNEGVKGKVYVEFIIEKDGSITNTRIIKGLSEETDKEVLRLIGIMPNWTPGTHIGKLPVKSQWALIIEFP